MNSQQTESEWYEHCEGVYTPSYPLFSDVMKTAPPNHPDRERMGMMIRYFKDILAKYPTMTRLIDIGAQDGFITEKIRKLGYDVTAVEPVRHFWYWGQLRYKKIHWHCDILENIKFDKQFDLAVVCETLEHVYDPEKFMKAVYDNLKPGGNVFISVPTIERANYITHRNTWGLNQIKEFIGKYFNIQSVETAWQWHFVVSEKGISKNLTENEFGKLMAGMSSGVGVTV